MSDTRLGTPVLVTGATGRVGRLVVGELLAAGVPVRALTRRPEAANPPLDVEVVAGDLTVPETLDAPLSGVRAVFLVWTAAAATAPAVIERIAASTGRIVLLSSPHQTPHPFFQQRNRLADLHAHIEKLIAGSGAASTILRPGMFASNTAMWWSSMIREHGVVSWPYAEAETAPIDERDIAAVAARALLDDAHIGGDYVLTGPERLTQAEQVRIIADAIGRPIRFDELSPDQFRQATAGRWPAAAVEMLLAAWHASMGTPAYMTSTVADILGSPARTFRQWAADHTDVFLQQPT
jgi:uncharacterized protein YbjT (DUF2867 family)